MYKTMLEKCFLVICILVCQIVHEILSQNLTSAEESSLSETSVKSKLSKAEEIEPDTAKDLGTSEPGFDLTEEEMTKFKIWPKGVIPYYIDDLSFDKVFRDRLRSFLETVSSTGLHFFELPKPPEDESRWVFFLNRRGALHCYDYTTDDFTNSGVQKVVLGYDCLTKERALAGAVLALAGVPPQHNAPDRDQYVQINNENILPEKQKLFNALASDEWLFHDLKYDYKSAGHFDWHKYSVNGKATITPKQKVNENDPEVKAFSSTDLQKIRMLYNFISKNDKVGSAKIAECNQLFVPGTSFANYEPESEETMKPRSKPRKYLNLPDEKETNVKNKLGKDINEKYKSSEETDTKNESHGDVAKPSKSSDDSERVKNMKSDANTNDNKTNHENNSSEDSATEDTAKSKVSASQAIKIPGETFDSSDYNTKERLQKYQKLKFKKISGIAKVNQLY